MTEKDKDEIILLLSTANKLKSEVITEYIYKKLKL